MAVDTLESVVKFTRKWLSRIFEIEHGMTLKRIEVIIITKYFVGSEIVRKKKKIPNKQLAMLFETMHFLRTGTHIL